jgi:hypothetical protein
MIVNNELERMRKQAVVDDWGKRRKPQQCLQFRAILETVTSWMRNRSATNLSGHYHNRVSTPVSLDVYISCKKNAIPVVLVYEKYDLEGGCRASENIEC